MSDIRSTARPQSIDADALEALAQQTKRPIAEVRDIYETEFARLKQGARVTDYLALFASRRVRETLSRTTG